MKGWVNSHVELPDSETECFLVVRIDDAYDTHKKLAEYCDGEWVDIDGEVVENVVWWMEAPKLDRKAEILEKLRMCAEHDTCEKRDCCYFVVTDEIFELMDYMKGE